MLNKNPSPEAAGYAVTTRVLAVSRQKRAKGLYRYGAQSRSEESAQALVEPRQVPDTVIYEASRLESLLFSGYDPRFEGDGPPGLCSCKPNVIETCDGLTCSCCRVLPVHFPEADLWDSTASSTSNRCLGAYPHFYEV